MSQQAYWTAEMVRDLPDDGNRYEAVYGELLVTPSPALRHQWLVGRLYLALGQYLLDQESLGVAMTSPGDISWGADTLVQPDIFVVRRDEARAMDWRKVDRLLLVVEILGPSSRRADRFTKRRRYQDAGIPLYWIVDPDEQCVEIWTPPDQFPAFERERLNWQPEGAVQPFRVDLVDLFRPI